MTRFLISLSLTFFLTACGSLQSMPSQSGDWGWMLPTEDSFWIHEPGQPFYEAYALTKRMFEEEYGPESCPMKRMAFTPYEGPIPYVGEYTANGMIGRTTRKAYSMIINVELAEDTQERLVVHEMLHACGMRGNVGADRNHSDPARWHNGSETTLDSIEARATCELQGRLCGQY